VKFRKWMAWKLQQLAARVYYAEWEESITIRTPSGQELVINVIGDDYACGIASTYGIRWDPTPTPMTAEVEGFTFTWTDPVKLVAE